MRAFRWPVRSVIIAGQHLRGPSSDLGRLARTIVLDVSLRCQSVLSRRRGMIQKCSGGFEAVTMLI